MSFCVIEINKYCINSNNTFINLLNILLDYITNTNNLSTLYRFFRLNSFMTCLDRIKYQCHSSVAQKKTIIIKQSDSNITGDRNNSSSSSVDRERERKSNICWEQIRTQMGRRERFFLLIYHAYLLVCIGYWYR
jgi:hypothetical protein